MIPVEPRTSALMTTWLTDRIFGGPVLIRVQEFVEGLVCPRKLARVLGTHQIDTLHPGSHVLVIAAVTTQAHQVLSELQADLAERFIVGAPANGSRGVI